MIRLNDIFPYILTCGNTNEKNCPPSGTPYEERVVKWYELELILWGEGYIITEGIKIPVRKGDLLFRKPGMVVQGVAPYYCYLIIFDLVYTPEKIPIYAEPNYLNNSCIANDMSVATSEFELPYIMKPKQTPKLVELFQNLYYSYINNSRNSQFQLRTYLMQILMHTYNEWSKLKILQQPSRSILNNYQKIIEVREYIDNNLHSKVTLQKLADIAELSPNFLCNIFKRITGVNIIEYVNVSKINAAKKALIDTNKSIKEILFELGFENETYFYILFKKKEGISPLDYRVRHRQIVSEW